MSAGRRYRRRRAGWLWRKPGVELSAKTRAWIARLNAAHDDEGVSIGEFYELARGCADHLASLSRAEQIEAGCQLADHAGAYLFGQPVRTLAIEDPETP